MWKKCKINGTDFLLKHCVNGALHLLFVTDLVNLWYEEIQEWQLLQRCKEMNKLLEASDEVFLSHIWSLVEEEVDEVTRSLNNKESGKELILLSRIDNLKFRMKFLLLDANNEQFFREVLHPLLTTVSELEKRQQLLMDIIKQKDMEINEYKLEGAKISRKAVETTPFNFDLFSQNCAKELGVTKSVLLTCPAETFTPFVLSMLENVQQCPLQEPQENHSKIEEQSQKNKKRGFIKLKSPVKEKKPKSHIYEDDDDVGGQQTNIKKEDHFESKECEIKQEVSAEDKKSSVKPRLKVQNALKNL